MPQRFPFIRSSSRRSSLVFAIVVSWLAVCLIVPAARAQIWNETTDAGELPYAAQVTIGTGPLTEINGMLFDGTDVDMYCIHVTDSLTFRARLGCIVIQGPDIRLFKASGVGASANFLCQGGVKDVSGAFATTTGTYYLAVSYRGREPLDTGLNSIWLPNNLAEHAPDGPGATGVIFGWGGIPIVQPINPYRIVLTGAGFCDAATATRARSWGTLKQIYR